LQRRAICRANSENRLTGGLCSTSLSAEQGVIEMYMRIVWGKILPGQWDTFEAAFKKAIQIRGEVKGLKNSTVFREPIHDYKLYGSGHCKSLIR
jgi:hypothetical protein